MAHLLNGFSSSSSSPSLAAHTAFDTVNNYTSVSFPATLDTSLLSSTESSLLSIPSSLSLATSDNSFDKEVECLTADTFPKKHQSNQQLQERQELQDLNSQQAQAQQQRPISTFSNNTISSRSTLDQDTTVRSKHASTASTTSTLKHFSIIFTDVHTSNTSPATAATDFSQDVDAAPDRLSNNSTLPNNIFDSYSSDTNIPSFMPSSASQAPSFLNSASTKSQSSTIASASSLNSITENVSILSYKKDTNKKHKKITKASISSPSELINHEDHFSSVPVSSGKPARFVTTPVAPQDLGSNFKKTHRSRNSVIASISHLNPFQRDTTEIPFMASTPKPLNKQPSLQSMSSQTSTSSLRLSRLSDFKNAIRSGIGSSKGNNTNGGKYFRSSSLSSRLSFLGVSSSFRNSTQIGSQSINSSSSSISSNNGGGSSTDKPIISLPTPVETSREKLKNKLRASTSLLSLTRLDRSMNNAVMAVPVEQYNLSQMEKLLNLCQPPTVLDFQAYIDRARADENVKRNVFSKISVTTYSEVFSQGSKVYKIIPFGNEDLDQSAIQDILQEIEISQTLQGLDGYIELLDIVVVKGRYPQQLLSPEYDTYTQSYADNQMYCILVQNNAGRDLRRFHVESWVDAESIFWQTAVALAQAEDRFQFEHRDLHWGNIVVDDRPAERVVLPQEGDGTTEYNFVDECGKQLLARSTLRITLIDYTLSRINTATSGRTATIHTRLDQPEFFRGKGDYQLDVYRFMRNNIVSNYPSIDNESMPNTPTSFKSISYSPGVDWSVYAPKTNVYWLHYVAERLINHKGLQSVNTNVTMRRNGVSFVTTTNPMPSRTSDTSETLEGGLQAEQIQSCRTLEAVYRALDPRGRRNNSNDSTISSNAMQDLSSAKDVIRWGLKNNTFPGHIRL